MELNALTTTCKHLRTERDNELAKLAKQKHAAHTMCYRLRGKLRKVELSNRMLIAMFLATENHNRILRESVIRRAQDAMEELPELGV